MLITAHTVPIPTPQALRSCGRQQIHCCVLRKMDCGRTFYGTNRRGTTTAALEHWKAGGFMDLPTAYVDDYGSLRFSDGRHRVLVALWLGNAKVPVAVPIDCARL
jgi:hypothetical protein